MVADDTLLSRQGIVHVLRDVGIDVVAEAHDGESLLARVIEHRPELAVVDIRMPPTHTDEGIVAAQRIREEYPDVAVLLLSQYVETAYALRLLETTPGKVGYLLKERILDAETLTDAIRRIGDGETVVDPTLVSMLIGRLRRHDPIDTLTVREREVLSLLAEGMSNKAIAGQLYVAERTVEAHVTSIFLKLGLDENPHSHRRVLAVLTFLRS